MKTINTYIVEKLHINKDIKNQNHELEELYEKLPKILFNSGWFDEEYNLYIEEDKFILIKFVINIKEKDLVETISYLYDEFKKNYENKFNINRSLGSYKDTISISLK